MKVTMLLFSIFAFTSCGKILSEQDTKVSNLYVSAFTTSNPIFDSYKENFEDNYYIQTGETISTSEININLSEQIEDNKSFIAVCIIWGGKKEIIIKDSFWNLVGEETRKSIIHHELGHCALGRVHNNDLDETTGRPLSLMHSNIVGGQLYESYFSEYMEELFR